jgi:hypothetical protein
VLGRQGVEVRPVFGAISLATHATEDFGRQYDLLASSPTLREVAAQDLLGDTLTRLPTIDIGGVPKVDAQFQGVVHDLVAVFLGRLRAEVHRPQTEATDFQACAT